MTRSSRNILSLVVLAFAWGNAPLHATVDLHLSGFVSGGSMFYPGSGAPLIGSVGVDTINAANKDYCFCFMSFTTGNLTGSDATNWFFASGGSITLAGTAYHQLINNPLVPAGTLLTGNLTNTTLTFVDVSKTVGYSVPPILKLKATFLATIDPALLNVLGLPVGVYQGSLSVSTGSGSSIIAPPDATGCGGCIDFVDVYLNPVPEPGAAVLVVTAMAITGLIVRRRTGSRL